MNAAEARGIRLVMDAFPGISPEPEAKSESKKRHPANAPAPVTRQLSLLPEPETSNRPPLTPVPSLLSAPGPTHMAPRDTELAAIAGRDLTGDRLGVMAALIKAGEHGLTGVEADAALGKGRPSGSSRLSEIVNKYRWADDSGKRRPTPTGCKAIVFVVNKEGREAFEVASRLNARAS